MENLDCSRIIFEKGDFDITTSIMNSPQAFISYDRLHAGVNRVVGNCFDLVAFKKALDKAGVEIALFHITAMLDVTRLNILSQRLNLPVKQNPSNSASFFEAALRSKFLQDQHYSPCQILIFGAEASEAALICELCDRGNAVTVFHWANEFDVAVLKAAHSCYALSPHLLLNLREHRLAAFAQAE